MRWSTSALLVAAVALASGSCRAAPRGGLGAYETITAFRQRTSAVLATSGTFQDAARYLRNIDYLGEQTAIGRCRPFEVQEAQLRALLVKEKFISDTNPDFLPKRQAERCRAYRRESSCASGTNNKCAITDALQVCFHSEPWLDRCRFTRAVWAARFRGVNGASATAVADDGDYRVEVVELAKWFELERR